MLLGLTTRDENGELTGRGNSAFLLGGATSVAFAAVVLLMKGSGIPRDIMLLTFTLAAVGLAAISLVDFPVIGKTGLFLSIPFLVPIILGVVRLFHKA
jgi:hypothetical protein